MELFRALAALMEPPGDELARLARLVELGPPPSRAEHTELFVLELYPYASVHAGTEGMLGGDARDRIAGFWRALHRAPPPEPDHLAVLLAFHAGLIERSRGARHPLAGASPTGRRHNGGPANPATVADDPRRRWQHARRVFFWEHIASWVFRYLDRVDELAPAFYVRWSALLRQLLAAEAAELGPPQQLPLHLREAPPLPDPDQAGLDEFAGALLAPVRSGAILTRSDVARAARELGLGVRVGERRFMLRSLLGQDAVGTFAWLEAELERRAEAHEAVQIPGHTAIAAFWAGRARAGAATARACLDRLAAARP